MKPWLIRQKQACEKEFIDSLQLLSDRHEASLQLLRICSEFEDATYLVHNDANKNGQLWLLVRCAKLWGPWEILRGGSAFVDLPGTGDSNTVL